MAAINEFQVAQNLANYAEYHGLLELEDRRWAVNQLLALMGCDGCISPGKQDEVTSDNNIDNLLHQAFLAACHHGAAVETFAAEERFCAAAMNLLMPRPSQVQAAFQNLLQNQGPQAACDYLYQLGIDSTYIHQSAIARNLSWGGDTKWGKLEITINLSKPEKDPRDIARLAQAAAPEVGEEPPFVAYPACQLCLENQGYQGRLPGNFHGEHPARQNLRMVSVPLGGETWALQYSPYSYYQQHCIAISPDHRPMHIDRETFGRLLDFVDVFPQYFVGSNADLPLVGGSILNHDHFQGGKHTFPMDLAFVERTFDLPAFPQVSCGVLEWPLTVLRLESEDRQALLDAATHVLVAWRGYSDEQAGVVASSPDGALHNTITPIARKKDATYRLDLALRCNITSAQHPLGVFHPHAHLHHLKKENIGLIEVMGMAILPGRLQKELAAVKDALVRGASLEEMQSEPLTTSHAQWASELAKQYAFTEKGASAIIRHEVGQAFAQVLECCGVLHDDALDRFLTRL